MAYGNWEGCVIKNGKRRMDKEDVGVWDIDEANMPKSLRIFANILKQQKNKDDSWENHSHHAVLGDGAVRLCGYKDEAELWVYDKKAEMTKNIKIWGFIYEENSDKDKKFDFGCLHNSFAGEVEVSGKTWKYKIKYLSGASRIELILIGPNGSKWTGYSQYAY